MTSYIFGSPEAIEAFVHAVEDGPAHSHIFSESEAGRKLMANALETAFFAGCFWAEDYTGVPVQESSEWPEHFGVYDLSCHQMIGLIYAMQQAMELGDRFARAWLSERAEIYGVNWI